jgi:hypothetical protein
VDASNGNLALTLTYTGRLYDLEEFMDNVNDSHLDPYTNTDFKTPTSKETP